MRNMNIVKVSCDWCGRIFGIHAEKVTARNFHCRSCLWAFYSRKLGRKMGPRTRVYIKRGSNAVSQATSAEGKGGDAQ